MDLIHIQYYSTQIGELVLGTHRGKLCLLAYQYWKMRTTADSRIKQALGAQFCEQENDLLQEAKQQVDEYLDGSRTEFDLPIVLTGTEFQKKVWKELQKVSYGNTASYLDLAKSINHQKAVRAVANALAANPLALIVPCHRIIGSNGKLTGYAGGLAAKQFLLELESEHL